MFFFIVHTSVSEPPLETLVTEEYRVPPRFLYYSNPDLKTPVSRGSFSPSATYTLLSAAEPMRWIVKETPERQAAIREFVAQTWRHYRNNPKQFGTPPAPDSNLVTIRLKANGTIIVGRKLVKAAGLRDALTKLAAKNSQPPISITCDDGAGPTTHIYKACAAAGLTNILMHYDE